MKLSILFIGLIHVTSAWTSHRRPSFRLVALRAQEDPEQLREQAERLRQQVASLEQAKQEELNKELAQAQAIQQEKETVRERYSAVVPILKPDGSTNDERVDFPPRWSEGSFITTCTASLPLGIILGESNEFPGLTMVDEVVDESNGEAAGIQVGDIVRAFTACKVEMEMPTWQLLAGGIGVPKTKRFMYSVDGRPFEEVMDAIGSNRMDPDERPVLIVVERRES